MNLKNDFIRHLQNSFEGLKNQPLDSLISENLLSSFTVELPRGLLAEIQKTVAMLFSLREKKSYQDFYS